MQQVRLFVGGAWIEGDQNTTFAVHTASAEQADAFTHSIIDDPGLVTLDWVAPTEPPKVLRSFNAIDRRIRFRTSQNAV